MHVELPVELWIVIFHLALEDDAVFDYSLSTTWQPALWHKLTLVNTNKWTLRTPQDELASLQLRRTRLLKGIVSTCKYWNSIATEFLYTCLYFETPSNIVKLCNTLDRDRQFGRFVKRLHITRYFTREGLSTGDLELGLVSVIQHCRKLEIFVIEWPVHAAFTAIADALCTYCARTLRTLYMHVPSAELAKLIWTLDTLNNLRALHLEIGEKVSEDVRLGSAGDIRIVLPKLEELSLRGYSSDFIEQAIDWDFPRLTSFSFDFGSYRDDLPDILEFLGNHGTGLLMLDINCIPMVDIPTTLNLCPSLTHFAFNLDWRLGEDEMAPNPSSKLVYTPHTHITHIGLHGLSHAFGVGYAATYARLDPITPRFVRRSNDFNFAALNKTNFPKLKCVRSLNRTLLRDLEASNGPTETCLERWERWSNQCGKAGVSFEDCTGSSMGDLPELDEEDDEDDGDDESGTESVVPADPIAQVRALANQCRQMTAALMQGSMVPPPSNHL